MKAFQAFCILVFNFLMLSSCNTGTTSGRDSIGRGSEILVVCDSAVWDDTLGTVIRNSLTAPLSGFPASIPSYHLIHVPVHQFIDSLQWHHNILIVNVGEGQGKTQLETIENAWSEPQRIVKMQASSDTAFIRIFDKHFPAIKEFFDRNERERFRRLNNRQQNIGLENALEDSLRLALDIPSIFGVATLNHEIAWLESNGSGASMGALISTFPYTDTSQISLMGILNKRNYLSRKYAAAAKQRYSMAAGAANTAFYQNFTFKGMFAIESRGTWNAIGDTAGGAFINFTLVDAKHNRIVSLDGYTSNSNPDQQNSIRQLEAMLLSVRTEKK